MKRSNLKNNNKSQKSIGEKIVKKAEDKIKEAQSRGVAVLCSGNSMTDFYRPSLNMDF